MMIKRHEFQKKKNIIKSNSLEFRRAVLQFKRDERNQKKKKTWEEEPGILVHSEDGLCVHLAGDHVH